MESSTRVSRELATIYDHIPRDFIRTFFQRLASFITLGIDLYMVFDGPHTPLKKRWDGIVDKSQFREAIMAQQICTHLGVPVIVAPGEGEAECARLQKKGLVDFVFSSDADVLLFGATKVVMYSSDWAIATNDPMRKQEPRTAAANRKLSIFDLSAAPDFELDRLILQAILQGGDYDQGLFRFGPIIAKEAAHPSTGFAKELINIFRDASPSDIPTDIQTEKLVLWRNRFCSELKTNRSGYFSTKHPAIIIPENFPSTNVINSYLHPFDCENRPSNSSILDYPMMKDPPRPKLPDIGRLQRFISSLLDWESQKPFYAMFLAPLLTIRIRLGDDPNDLYKVKGKKRYQDSSLTDNKPHPELYNISIIPQKVIPQTDVNADGVGTVTESNTEFNPSEAISCTLPGHILAQSLNYKKVLCELNEVKKCSISKAKRAKTFQAPNDHYVTEFFKVARRSDLAKEQPRKAWESVQPNAPAQNSNQRSLGRSHTYPRRQKGVALESFYRPDVKASIAKDDNAEMFDSDVSKIINAAEINNSIMDLLTDNYRTIKSSGHVELTDTDEEDMILNFQLRKRRVIIDDAEEPIFIKRFKTARTLTINVD